VDTRPDFTFDEWVLYVFDNPPNYRWFDLLGDWGVCPPATLVQYLTRLFENSSELLQPFSNAQLNQSFWFLLSVDSDAQQAMFDMNVPWPERRRCFRAIYTLFDQCLAKRCSPYLSHINESSENPLNSACYMWWDLFPAWGQPNDPHNAEIDDELLKIMQRILWLDSDACRESALHGLGHWSRRYPDRVKAIVDEFLDDHPQLRPELRRYANGACTGCIQ
jgi:hypothetical protein